MAGGLSQWPHLPTPQPPSVVFPKLLQLRGQGFQVRFNAHNSPKSFLSVIYITTSFSPTFLRKTGPKLGARWLSVNV